MEKTVKRSKQMDMLHGPMMKNILLFALPLAASGILQQLFTSADMAVIFWFEGSAAQGAVNSNGALVNLLINLFSGMSVGATVVITQMIGRKHTDDIHSVVFTSLVVAAVSGVVLLGVGIGVSKPLLEVMDTPYDVLPLATQYLRIYFIGMPFLMVFNFGAAILRSVGDTKCSLFILLVTGVLNVGLNFLFVAACKMSVAGVAVATVIANFACAVLVLFFIMRNDMLKMRFKKSKFRGNYFKRIFAIGIPAGLQGVVFSLANVFIQTAVNGFGAKAVAGNGDAVNFEYYAYFFINAFAQTTVTFFGQNFAAGEYARCKRLFMLNMLASVIVSAVLSAVFALGGKLFIRIYTTDEAAIKFALMRMWSVLTGVTLSCLYEIAGGALRGMGHSLLPAVMTIIGSCILRIIWIYTVFVAYKKFWVLVIVYPISWAVTGVAVLIAYFVICNKEFKAPQAAKSAEQQSADAPLVNSENIAAEVAATESAEAEENTSDISHDEGLSIGESEV
ncbi:MAG: MATE family efflux transporter [Clostridiales bacterium]|nr:MATE family efflux transporter [Clostridiales bacterium]